MKQQFKRFVWSNFNEVSFDQRVFQDHDKDDHEWDRPLEFIFSLISNSVGLGNVWRFPYLAAKSGGGRFFFFSFLFNQFSCFPGAFLIPYFVLYFLIGAPIYYLELALGQFSSRGPATAFILAKGWQGNRNKSFSRKNPRCSIDVEVLDLRW